VSIHFLEMTYLDEAKETENKRRWDVMVEDAKFSLYIPKWRIPEPPPKTIAVLLVPGQLPPDHGLSMAPDRAFDSPELRRKPIVATISRTREHTKTLRYDPLGDSELWEIGSPYIPFSLTFDQSLVITLVVFWSVDEARTFQRQLKPT